MPSPFPKQSTSCLLYTSVSVVSKNDKRKQNKKYSIAYQKPQRVTHYLLISRDQHVLRLAQACIMFSLIKATSQVMTTITYTIYRIVCKTLDFTTHRLDMEASFHKLYRQIQIVISTARFLMTYPHFIPILCNCFVTFLRLFVSLPIFT